MANSTARKRAALYFALAAYVNTFLLRRVLAPYLTDENTEEE